MHTHLFGCWRLDLWAKLIHHLPLVTVLDSAHARVWINYAGNLTLCSISLTSRTREHIRFTMFNICFIFFIKMLLFVLFQILNSNTEFHFKHNAVPHARKRRSISHTRSLRSHPEVSNHITNYTKI